MDTGSMIEMSRMQLKTFSYMLTRSIKGGDFSIQIMPIKVYKSSSIKTDMIRPSKVKNVDRIRIKAKREHERIEREGKEIEEEHHITSPTAADKSKSKSIVKK